LVAVAGSGLLTEPAPGVADGAAEARVDGRTTRNEMTSAHIRAWLSSRNRPETRTMHSPVEMTLQSASTITHRF
jgi:hypothetical protein